MDVIELDNIICQVLSNRADERLWEGFSATDWQGFGQRAKRHGVSGLIYWQWRTAAPANVPMQIISELRQTYLATLARNTILLQELDRILQMLLPLNLSIILLKGAVFARTLYEDIALRPMSDLDILIPKAELEKAVTALLQHGYYEPVLHQREMLKKVVAHDIHLRQISRPNVDVEVHWLLGTGEGYRQKVDMNWFWSEALPLDGFPHNVYSLSPTATLLYLCAHLAYQHGIGMAGLLWFVDIARWIEKYNTNLDWEKLAKQAETFQWSAAVYYTLLTVQERFGSHIPVDFIQRIHAQIKPSEERQIQTTRNPIKGNAEFAFVTFCQLTWHARIKDIISRLFPSLAFMRVRFRFRNNWLAVLYYPIRWIELGRKFWEFLQQKYLSRH